MRNIVVSHDRYNEREMKGSRLTIHRGSNNVASIYINQRKSYQFATLPGSFKVYLHYTAGVRDAQSILIDAYIYMTNLRRSEFTGRKKLRIVAILKYSISSRQRLGVMCFINAPRDTSSLSAVTPRRGYIVPHATAKRSSPDSIYPFPCRRGLIHTAVCEFQ